MEQPTGERTPISLQGALVLKMVQMMQFRDEIRGDEGNMLRDLCKMVKMGNRMLIDPMRRLTDRI